MRIDRVLCNLRFLRTRSLAAELVRRGHLRRNGERVTRPSQAITVGDVLTIPSGLGVTLVEVLALPERRGPASEARGCYRVLDPKRAPELFPELDRAGQIDLGRAPHTTTQGDAAT